MDSKKLETEFNKLRNLHQYRYYDREDLMDVAYKRIVERYSDIESLLQDKEEIKKAKALLKKYLQDFTPETISDIQTLSSVIFLEILNLRLQKLLNDLHTKSKTQPLHMVETIHRNLKNIQELKAALGMTREGQKTEEKDVAKKIEEIKKQFKVWRSNNQGSRNIICPDCGQMIWLKIRTKAWEAQKHPFFKDRILHNSHLVKMFFDKKISKEDVAGILECSPDYIDWLIDKWYRRRELETKSKSKKIEESKDNNETQTKNSE
jgi:DNA-directed RNA polymerase subunit RPC12/RpoP